MAGATAASGFVLCFMFPADLGKLCADLLWSLCPILHCLQKKNSTSVDKWTVLF